MCQLSLYSQNACQVFYNNKVDKQTGCQLIADASYKEGTPKPIKSFDQYRKNKGKQWKTKCQKNKGKPKEEEVTILQYRFVGVERKEVETSKGEKNCS